MKKGILKVVLIGDGGVGKTAIRVQYIHKRFTNNYKATIGADFITKDVQLEDGKTVSMQIWDTAGQERFQSLGIAYYRGADACIIVYDVTNPDSFNNVLNWEQEFIDKAGLNDPSTYPFILIGNKTDIEDERVISKKDDSIDYEDYDDLKKYRIPYFEVSAKYGDNIEEAFRYIAKTVQLPQFEFLIEGDVIDWNDGYNEKNSKLKCCT
ncbi:hypothetical protein PIROE2DRAFT_66663 [Piromyces sp. E2]|nr:hypothetical protein PIROE2DRAFT_66663 [Piromyces sp. E2]|eukprot:OUM56963.1 hypothetical protein PIROE2DRAFT_66663 [Piromyces sp. E2]